MAFVAVARADEIPVGHGTFVERGGLALAVFNAGGGRFHATGPICPHEDGPLSEGWLEAGVVEVDLP
jgi:nitrite reductase/ring-hydroxylating ferredoxin subunit